MTENKKNKKFSKIFKVNKKFLKEKNNGFLKEKRCTLRKKIVSYFVI